MELITCSNNQVDSDVERLYKKLIAKRKAGVPVAYLTGSREFWSLELKVTEDTLIPRPETELLVETALALMDMSDTLNVLDLGTGSGAIALAIASERPNARITAVDNDHATLDIARENALSHQLANVEFLISNWFERMGTCRYDLIISNPPYIAAEDPHLSKGDLRHEPRQALVSGVDGLDDLHRIISRARDFLNANGWLLVEHGYHQADQVRQRFEQAGFGEISQKRDLGGIFRITMGKRAE